MDEAAFAVLDAELRARHRDIQRIGDRIEERRGSFVSGAEAVDSLGYQLHNLYGAVEQLFEEVARSFENRIEAAGYHVNLIRRMQLDIPGIWTNCDDFAIASATPTPRSGSRRRSRRWQARPGRSGKTSPGTSNAFWRGCGRNS